MSGADETLTIDVVSDVVCPWCYVGEKRLGLALADEQGPVEIRWRPFQLDPTIPQGGLDRAEYMERKFGKGGRLKEVHDRLTALGAEVGIPFAFDRIRRAPNTLDAHRLIRWAASTGRQAEAVDRLFRAYFVEGLDVGDPAVLVPIARECGLDPESVATLLGGDDDKRRGQGRDRPGAGDRSERRALLHLRGPARGVRRAGRGGSARRDGAGAGGDARRACSLETRPYPRLLAPPPPPPP